MGNQFPKQWHVGNEKGASCFFCWQKSADSQKKLYICNEDCARHDENKQEMEKKRIELRKLLEAVEKEVLRKPRQETLDHLALFAGYQDWDGFLNALHGDSEGLSNYEEGPLKYKGRQGAEPEKDK